jgi:hypothetical protein
MKCGGSLPGGESLLGAGDSLSKILNRPAVRSFIGALVAAELTFSGLAIYDIETPDNKTARSESCAKSLAGCAAQTQTAKTENTLAPTTTITSNSTSTTTTSLPETTPTTLALPSGKVKAAQYSMTCEEIVESVSARVPRPDGWQTNCTELEGWCRVEDEMEPCDGQMDPSTKTVTLYFGDRNDNNQKKMKVTAHEFAHMWHTDLGLLYEYSVDELEEQADSFAFAFGYYADDDRGSEAGALAVCKLFRDHGADLC